MAISLDRASRPQQKKALKKKVPLPPRQAKSRAVRRPWQHTSAPTTEDFAPRDPGLHFEFQAQLLRLTPENLDAADSTELVKILAQNWLENLWKKSQQKSYWLSRLTHRESWLSRVRIYPQVRIPVPSWLTTKQVKPSL